MIVVADPSASTLVPSFIDDQTSFRARAAQPGSLLGDVALRVDSHGEVDVETGRTSQSLGANELMASIVERSRRATERFPSSLIARRNLGLALINAGDARGAITTLEAVGVTKDRGIRSTLARAYAEIGDLQGAESLYLGLRAESPRDAQVVARLAEVALRSGRADDAVQHWRSAVALDPQESSYHYWLGLALLAYRQARADEAIHELKIATRLRVRSAEFHSGLAVAYAVAPDLARAERAFRQALHLQPGMASAVEGLVTVLLASGHAEGALVEARKLLGGRQNEPRAHELLGRVFYAGGNYQDARLELFRALQIMSEAKATNAVDLCRVANNLGVCYANLGDDGQARRFFERSKAAAPHAATDARLNLARLDMHQHRYDAAVAEAEECRQLHPANEPAQLVTAIALARSGAPASGAEMLDGWLRTPAASGDAYAVLSAIRIDQLGEVDRAIDILRVGLEHFPHHVSIRNNLAYAYLMQGRADEAREILNATPDVRGVSGVPLTATRGLLRLWEGDLPGGVALYELAENVAGANDVALAEEVAQKRHLEVAKALLRAGDRTAALAEARRGLSLNGRPEWHRELAEMLDEDRI